MYPVAPIRLYEPSSVLNLYKSPIWEMPYTSPMELAAMTTNPAGYPLSSCRVISDSLFTAPVSRSRVPNT